MTAEIASAYISLLPSLRGFGRETERQLGPEVDSSGERTGRRFGSRFSAGAAPSIRGGFGKLGGIAAGAFAAAGVGSIFKDSINQASDLNEATTKLQAIFGAAGEAQVQAFAKNGPRALGQNKLAVLDSAATFGTFGKAAGLTGVELAKFSTGFAGLATDLASFNNTSPEQAVDAIGAALRGEAEPLRSYGVLLDDASLRQEALRLGLIKTTKTALTPQQKVLAAQALIYKQTKDAQGDFARTSGGLANQQRILSASITDLKGRFGQLLLPILVKATNGINRGLLPAVDRITGAAKQVFGVLFKGDFKGGPFAEDSRFVDVLFRVRDGFGQLRSAASRVVGVIRDKLQPPLQRIGQFISDHLQPIVTVFAGALGGSLSGALVGVAGVIGGVLLAPLIALVGALSSPVVVIGALVGALVAAYRGSEQFRNVVGQVADFTTGTLLPAFQRVGQFLVSTFQPTFVALRDTFVTSVLPALRGLFDRVRENLPQIQAFAKVVGAVIVVVAAVGAKVAGFLLPILIRLQGTVFKALIATIGVAIGIFGRVVSVIATVVSAFSRFGSAVATAISAVVRFVGALPGRIVDALSSLPGFLSRAGKSAFEALGKAVGTAVTGLLGFVKGIPGRVVSAIGDLGNLLLDVGKQIIGGLLRGIKEKAGDIAGAITGPLTGAVGIAKKALGIFSPSRVFATIGEQTMQGYVVGVGKQAGAVGRSVTDTMRGAIDAAKASGKKLLDVLTDQLNKSREKLTSLIDAGRTLREGIAENLSGSISSLFGANNVTDILAAQSDRLINLTGYLSALDRLKSRKGISNDLINQLKQADPNAAGKFVGLLANSTDAQLAGFVGRQKDLARTSAAAGRSAELATYGTQIGKLNQIVNATAATVRNEQAQLAKLDAILTELKRSPAKTAAGVGQRLSGAIR